MKKINKSLKRHAHPCPLHYVLVSQIVSLLKIFQESWVIPEKVQTGGGEGEVEDILSGENPWNLQICHFTLESPDKTSFHPWKFCMQTCMTPLRNSMVQKQDKDQWNFHIIFLSYPLEIPFLFQLTNWNLHMLFLQYPWKLYVLIPPVFFWNSLLSGHESMAWQPWKLFNFLALVTDELHCNKTRVQRVPSRKKRQEDIF